MRNRCDRTETEYTRIGTEVQPCSRRLRTISAVPVALLPLVLISGGVADSESAGSEPMRNQAPVTAFVDVHVVPLDREGILEGSTVLVEAGQIVALGPSGTVSIPDGATIIQGSGGYLIPGLTDMHFHADGRPEAFMLAVAYGITTVRNLNAEKGDFDLARRVADGELLGPSVYNGPSIGGVPRIWMPLVYAYQFLISIAVGLAVLGILWLALVATTHAWVIGLSTNRLVKYQLHTQQIIA